ncbi:MAG: TolC family protein [Planctomycetota bacterium]
MPSQQSFRIAIFTFSLMAFLVVGCQAYRHQIRVPSQVGSNQGSKSANATRSSTSTEPYSENQLVSYQEDLSVRDKAEPNGATTSSLPSQLSGEYVPVPASMLAEGVSYPTLSVGLPRPQTGLKELPKTFESITLEEAIAIALFDTKVLRSLSADIVRNAPNAASSFDPAINATDANFGIDAALAQFDASLNASALYANNDDYFNNPSTTGNATEVQQDLTTLNWGWNRVGQAGTQYTLSHVLIHDDNSNPSVLFPSSWENRMEATVRQPLLQGRGTLFNQIAGPNSRPGFLGTTGILISQSNYEISTGEFQRGVRDLVLEIITAYWQLDLAYQNYETIKSARDASYETWQIAKARFENDLPGGEADREAQARGQFYQFELQLDQALNASSQSNAPGVLQAEANLRRLLNLPQAGDQLIRPADAPAQVASVIDWPMVAQQATSERVEIRQQQSRIHQADLQLIAAKNFLMPRFDAVGTYRNAGLGDDLINDGGKFAGALNESWSGNYDEWEFGFTFDVPLGYRQARAGVENARLQAARERAVMTEIEQQILHELGSALRGVDQSTNSIQLAELRRDAARDTVKARLAAYDADAVGFEDLLEAQQQLLDAELALHNAKTDRELAMSRLFAESGTLLDEFQVTLSQ